MNIVDYVILGVIGISVLFGIYRGFLQSLLNTGGGIVSLFAGFFFGPRLAQLLRANDTIASTLATYTDAVSRVGDYDLAQTNVASLSQSTIQRVLDAVGLPSSIGNILEQNLETKAFAQSGLSTVNDYVASTIVAVAVNVLCFILCFVAAYIVMSIIINLLQNVLRFPLLKSMDWLAGAVFGVLRGALLVYVLFLCVPILETIVPIEGFSDLIAQSSLSGIFQSDGFFARVIAGKL